MKPRIVILTVIQLIGLLCLNAPSANTAAVHTPSLNTNAQISEAELTTKFNAILDAEFSGENVCVTISAARELNTLMKTSAQKIVNERAFNRVAEAEGNVRKFAKALLKNGTQSGHTRITTEILGNIISTTEPPESTGGGVGDVRNLFCPLFPIC
jgi:hypothetical protein